MDATNSTVLIDGQHIAGSPFPVYISIHPTQLGKPVRVWRNFCQPHSIIVNSKNEILVTERKGNIFKLTVEGREKLAGAKLRLVRGIACNKEDTAYCIDQLSNNIFKCDQKGMNRKIKNIPLDDEVKGWGSLCITNDEVVVSEIGLKGIIKIYSRDLKYIRDIEHKDMGLVNSISIDLQGNVYATDYNNLCIRIFNNKCDFLKSIVSDEQEMLKPWGVCVFGQYVYMTDVDVIVCLFLLLMESTSLHSVSMVSR